MRIGEKIKQLRKEKCVTQEQLGKILNVSYQAISKWENGDSMPDISLLVAIASYFEVTTDELLGYNQSIHRSGYKTHRDELLTIYSCDGTEEDFQHALTMYNEILLHGVPTTKDYMEYGYLYDVRSKRDIDIAIDYYKKAIENGKHNRDEYWFQTHQQLTILLVRSNRGNEAIEGALRWLEEESDNIEPYISVAFAYKEYGEYSKAYDYIQKAETFASDNITQLTFAGDICKNLKKYEEAISYWDRAYATNSEYCSCLYSKAFLFEELGEIDKAITSWQIVIDWHIRQGLDLGCELKLPMERIKILSGQMDNKI